MLRHPRFSGLYQLDIPNKEVRIGLMRSLLPNYVQRPAELNTLVAEKIYNGDMDGALVLMRTVLSTIPYCENTHYEGHYQQLLYVIFTLIGNYVDVEVRTPKGRVDMVMRTPTTLYVVELKLNKPRIQPLSNPFAQLPGALRPLRITHRKGWDQFRYGEANVGDWVIE